MKSFQKSIKSVFPEDNSPISHLLENGSNYERSGSFWSNHSDDVNVASNLYSQSFIFNKTPKRLLGSQTRAKSEYPCRAAAWGAEDFPSNVHWPCFILKTIATLETRSTIALCVSTLGDTVIILGSVTIPTCVFTVKMLSGAREVIHFIDHSGNTHATKSRSGDFAVQNALSCGIVNMRPCEQKHWLRWKLRGYFTFH